MKHTAKKVTAGEYQYRGHDISRCWTDFGGGEFVWYINYSDGRRSYYDPVNTLRQAKEAIDGSFAEQEN